MGDTVAVSLSAQDAQFIATTKQASSAMAALAAQEEKLAKVSKASGLDQKKFSQTFQKMERQRITEAARAGKQKERDEKKSLADIAKKQKASEIAERKRAKAASESKRSFTETKKLLNGDIAGLLEGGGAASAMGLAMGAITVAAAGTLVAIGALAFKAKEAKDNTLAMLNVLTRGRGDQTLGKLDALAASLGQKVGDVREQFTQFRQAGLGNKQSADLIKLSADLNTLDHSGKLAKQAIDGVLAYTGPNGTQTGLMAQASAAKMRRLAKDAGIAGDGTTSAAAAATTLAGALNRIDNDKVKVLERIGDKVAPAIDRAASSVANMLDKLVESKEGKRLLDGVADAIIRVAKAAEKAAPAVQRLIDSGAVQEAGGIMSDVVSVVYDAVAEVGMAFWEIPKAFWEVAKDLNTIVNYIATPFEDAGIEIFKAIGTWGPKALEYGANLVDGLISGISGAAGRLISTVSGLAGDVAEAFRKKLKIFSPSKVFAGFGMNIGAGLDQGLDRSMPDGKQMAERVKPEPEAMRNVLRFPVQPRIAAAATASAEQGQAVARGEPRGAAPEQVQSAQSMGGSDYQVTINIHGASDTEETKRALRRELDLWWASKLQQEGKAA